MSVHDPLLKSEILAARYDEVRAYTRSLVEGLSEEDCQLQSMADASPTKWHLAHVTWFFERFVLEPCGVARLDDDLAILLIRRCVQRTGIVDMQHAPR